MSFLYVNPGYHNLLGSTILGSLNTLETHSGDTKVSPCHGFSITPKVVANVSCKISLGSFADKRKGYVKFNLYFPLLSGASCEIYLAVSVQHTDGAYCYGAEIAYPNFYHIEGSPTLINLKRTTDTPIQDHLLPLTVNHILFYWDWSGTSTAGTILEINGARIWKNTSSFVVPSDGYLVFGICPASVGSCYISDLIVSDEEIPADAQVAILPAGNIETNMESVEGGLYTPKSGDPTWLMTPNITPLLESHLSSSKVYGLAVGANPCEVLGGGNATFTTLSKSEGTLTEHGTVTVTSAVSSFCDGWVTENTTLGDLANMQLGLKSGS